MTEAKYLTVTLKDEERRVNHKFLLYDDFEVRSDNEIISRCITEARESFKGIPEKITIKITLEIQ